MESTRRRRRSTKEQNRTGGPGLLVQAVKVPRPKTMRCSKGGTGAGLGGCSSCTSHKTRASQRQHAQLRPVLLPWGPLHLSLAVQTKRSERHPDNTLFTSSRERTHQHRQPVTINLGGSVRPKLSAGASAQKQAH